MAVALANDLSLGDISDVMGAVSFDFAVGQVAQFSFDAVDVAGKLSRSGLLKAGNVLRWDSSRWDVAAIERDYRGDSVWWTVECRSSVARRLRLMTEADRQAGVTPAQWITSRVRKAGGRATVEQGAKRRTINQKRGQSVLDVIASLASDTSVEWVEYGGQVFVGTPWWAFQGKTGLPTFPVAIKPQSVERGPLIGNAPLRAAQLTTRETLDDRQSAAEGTLTLEKTLGQFVRPWNRLDIVDAPEPDRGLWLVTSVSFDETGADVSVGLQRPLKSSPKNGSSGKSGEGAALSGDLGALDGDWIDGADRVWPGCSRSPREYVALALSRKGSYYEANRCARWVGDMIGARPGDAWNYWTASKGPKSKDPNPPRGAIVVWKPKSGGDGSPEWSAAGHGSIWGHVGIALGDGTFINATGGTVNIQSLASWGTGDGYFGACAPNY